MNNNDDGNSGNVPDLIDIQEPETAAAAPRRRVEKDPLEVLYRHHPECVVMYAEDVATRLPLKVAPVQAFSEDADKKDAFHRTQPFLTQFERTKIIGSRATQLAGGARPFIPVPSHVSDVVEIARMELEARKLPFIVMRPMPDGTFEVWRLSDLMVL